VAKVIIIFITKYKKTEKKMYFFGYVEKLFFAASLLELFIQ